MSKIRWGILATGNIAGHLARAITDADGGEIVAVASRTQEGADAFGDRWRIPRRYPAYEALVEDATVDVIYIATPHSHHYDNMLLCLNAGKHVLCEKPLTLDARQAAECIALARDKGLFLMEAMWMRYNPAIRQARAWVDDGELGEVRLIKADFCLNKPFDSKHRLYNPDLGGGALLDLGIYPLSFATLFMGLPDACHSIAQLNADTGVDELTAMTLSWADGRLASLSAASRIALPVEAYVGGSEGYIKVHNMFICPDRLTVHKKGGKPREHKIRFRSNGYVHEVEEVHACLRAGRTESAGMTLDETLATMKIMDAMRQSWGFQYPHEKAE